MTAALTMLLLCGAGTLALGLIVRGARRGPRRGSVTIHPAYRAWLRGLRLVEADDFLALPTLLVSGHPGRNVGRTTLGDPGRTVYLKREENVRWTTRLANLLAGFGWVSRPVREAQVLEALERDGLPGPRWLATGEDGAGRAFLLVEAVPGAVPLAEALRGGGHGERRRLAVRLGRTLARLHDAGFFHRDLYAKHVLINPTGGEVHLLDWQRAWRGAWIPRAARVRDLAALHATLPDDLAGPRDRLALLRGYAGGRVSRRLAAAVEAAAAVLRQRRHIREKRQAPPARQQAWLCLDGPALCVTPALSESLGRQPPDWLRLDRHVFPAGRSHVRRWVALPGRGPALLVCRRAGVSAWQRWRGWLTGRPTLAPEQRLATLLWRLERHGVRTPGVLALGARQSGGRLDSFVLIEPVGDTVRLGDRLAQADGERRRDLLRQAGAVLARLHDACCYLAPGGVERLAVRGGEVVLEDASRVEPSRRPRPECAARDRAALRAAVGADDWRHVDEGYAAHAPARAEVRRGGEGADCMRAAHTDATGAPPWWRRLTGAWRRLRERADWAGFVGPDWPGHIMHADVTDRYHAKQGRSTGRWVLERPGARLVVYLKRHHELPRWRGWLAALWPGGDWSPAMQEYGHLEWARQQGVPVPATVAAGEFLGPWGHMRSFLAVEELTGMLPLHEAIPQAQARQTPEAFRRWKRGLVAELARLARLLHDRRHFHKDLYLCHFFIHADHLGAEPAGGWRGRVWLIDLHRLTHHPWTWWLWLLKDLAQLLYSSEVPGVDVRDQLAFWRHYRGAGRRRSASRWLRRLVVFKWRRYRRHNERRRAAAGGEAQP